MNDGPPCLQFLIKNKISEGGRNNGLFNIGVYLRKAYPDSWESEILTYNMQYLEPPLPLNEVNIVAKQLEKKDYAYRCSDAPINAHCNKELCQTRKHGISAAIQGAAIANLRKYDSNPPVWFVDVNGEPLELDTDGLMNQTAFQKACMEQLNTMPRTVSKQAWETRIGGLMREMTANESAIIDVAEDASTDGQFYDYLEVYKIAQRLRDLGGESTLLKIKGRPVRVWKIPAYEAVELDLKTPDFGREEEAPF
jgi:hypothetical protein